MVGGLTFRKKENQSFPFFVFGDFPAEHGLMLEIRSLWDTQETEIRYDIKVIQDSAPQKHSKEEHNR